MRALILAAGYGSRLGHITKNTPKPLIKVGNKSVIERIIDKLHMHGISQILINVHYLPSVIIEKLDSNVLYYYEPRLLGHKGTILSLRKWLQEDDFLVINGDTISNVDFSEMIEFHTNDSITALMDEWRCAGTWIYHKSYFTKQDISVVPFRPHNLSWHDVGTKERLKEAKEFYK